MSPPILRRIGSTTPAMTGTWFLVILSVVSWQPGSLYTGGIDPVVVAKAAVAFTAFLCSLAIHSRQRVRGRLGIRSVLFFLTIVAVSCAGALAVGDPMPSFVLAVRITLVAATVYVLTSCAAPLDVLNSLLVAMGLLAVFGAVTGIPELLQEGRLASGIPAMRPNELAGLAAPPLVALAVEVTRSGLSTRKVALLFGFSVILFATGSRTTLFVVMLSVVLAIVVSWPVPQSTGIALILLVPVSYAIVAFTDIVSRVAIRGQDVEQLVTLSSRTIAWQAVLEIPMDTWHKWIGAGLAIKTVEVDQRWWDVQALDSSWVSVLSQTGIVGLVLVSWWVVATVVDSSRSRDLRWFALPMLTLLLIRSLAENGLIESSVIFILFFCISLVLEPGYRYPFPHHVSVRYPLVRAPLIPGTPAPDGRASTSGASRGQRRSLT